MRDDLHKPMQRLAAAAVVAATVAMAILAVSGCNERAKDTHPQKWVSKRQAVFKDFTRTLEPMGLMARERQAFNAEVFKAAAARLQVLSTQPWPLFTADSNYPPTLASPQVWAQEQKFLQAQQAFVASVAQLQLAAQAGTLAAARPAVEDVQQLCKACHEVFRLR